MRTLLERLKPEYKAKIEKNEINYDMNLVNDLLESLSKKTDLVDLRYGDALELSILTYGITNSYFLEMLDLFED